MRAPDRYSTDLGFFSLASCRTMSAMRAACSRTSSSCSALLGRQRAVHQEQLRVAEQRRQRIVDLVLERDGRLADAGEPARPRQLGLRRAPRLLLRDAPRGDREPRPQVLRRARLRHVVVGTGIQHLGEVRARVAPGDDEDERLAAGGVGADAAADLEPVEHGHAQVEDDERHRVGLEQLPRLPAVARRPRLVADVREHGGEQGAGDDVVIGEENAHAKLEESAQRARPHGARMRALRRRHRRDATPPRGGGPSPRRAAATRSRCRPRWEAGAPRKCVPSCGKGRGRCAARGCSDPRTRRPRRRHRRRRSSGRADRHRRSAPAA